ncbi:MAG: threonine/serine dehydratase [Geminicoccaceae bacterium]
MITLADIQATAARIAGRVRRTPLMTAAPTRAQLPAGTTLKVESLQVTGSFKARGATNKVLSLDGAALRRGLVTASGGNHGIAVAYAAWCAHVPATIVVPENVAPLKAAKIRSYGADLVVHGKIWDQSNAHAHAIAEERRATYVHPFADPTVVAGQGTVALEILADDPETDTILIAIGGGGLISGMAVAAKALHPGIRIVGVEPTGCPTMKAALDAGRIVKLDRIDTIVPTMAASATAELNFEICRQTVDEVVLVSDEAMREAAVMLWLELGIAADLSGAASMAALLTRAYVPKPGERVCALVCGAGPDGIG